MQACGEILRSNGDMACAGSLTPIALRMRDGEWEYPADREPDLAAATTSSSPAPADDGEER